MTETLSTSFLHPNTKGGGITRTGKIFSKIKSKGNSFENWVWGNVDLHGRGVDPERRINTQYWIVEILKSLEIIFGKRSCKSIKHSNALKNCLWEKTAHSKENWKTVCEEKLHIRRKIGKLFVRKTAHSRENKQIMRKTAHIRKKQAERKVLNPGMNW